MKLASMTLSLIVSLSPCVKAQPLLDRSADQNDILKAIGEISKAYVSRDPEPFSRYYLENYASIRGKPVFNMREQLLAMMRADSVLLKAGKRLDFDTIYYEAENPRFHFYGSVAILNVVRKNYWQYHGQKCLTTTHTTELWIRKTGDWKIAAGHVTTFQCEPKPYYPVHAAVAAIPSINKPPVNGDSGDEQQVRELILSLVKARNSGSGAFEAAVEKNVTADFVSTNVKGEVDRDRIALTSLPAPQPARAPGLRGQDEALVIYDSGAIFSYKLKAGTGSEAGSSPLQSTVFLVKIDGRWQIAAVHMSKYSGE